MRNAASTPTGKNAPTPKPSGGRRITDCRTLRRRRRRELQMGPAGRGKRRMRMSVRPRAMSRRVNTRLGIRLGVGRGIGLVEGMGDGTGRRDGVEYMCVAGWLCGERRALRCLLGEKHVRETRAVLALRWRQDYFGYSPLSMRAVTHRHDEEPQSPTNTDR